MIGTRRYTADLDLLHLGQQIHSAERVLVLTGAGISRASGLPTYRGQEGIYADSDIAALHHAHALPDSLPELWGFWGPRRATISQAQPNAAHLAVASFQRASVRSGRAVTLATQNVDDLHERAGSPQVAHLHGTLFATRCYDAACPYRKDPDRTPYDEPPHCPRCGSWLRPDVVLFGEPLDADAQWAAKRAVRECDLLLAVGTSGEVSTAATLIRYAVDVGALLVTIDPAPEVPPAFDVHVPLPAEAVLPALLD
jgi:NAD-dependent deacetylase